MPRRETEANRIAQRALAARVGRAFGFRMYESHQDCAYDYIAESQQGRFGLWEMKPRTCASTIPRVIIDIAKLGALREDARDWGMRAYVAFGFDDGHARYIDAFKVPDEVSTNGRKDRGDPADWEPVAWYRVADMGVIP